MPVEVIIAVVGTLGSVFVAWIVKMQNRDSKIAETNASDFRDLIAEYKEAAIVRTQERDQAYKERDEAIRDSANTHRENDALRDALQDCKEINNEYREYHYNHDEWVEGGARPPAPERSWRLRRDMDSFLSQASDPNP